MARLSGIDVGAVGVGGGVSSLRGLRRRGLDITRRSHVPVVDVEAEDGEGDGGVSSVEGVSELAEPERERA